MKKELEEEIAKDVKFVSLRNKKNVVIVVVLAIVILSAYFVPNMFVKSCGNFRCFYDSMTTCNKAVYVNEDPEASWQYKILGTAGTNCVVNVELLFAKEGEAKMEDLVGYDMECQYPFGVGAYPDKDLSKCHGRLKEELQTIIINKLHAYVMENMGQFEDSLNNLV